MLRFMNFLRNLGYFFTARFPIKIIDRYIVSECWLPFSSGCGIVTGVWLGADQVRDAFKLLANTNVDFSIALSIILLNIPQILLVTIPVGVLWATFLVFNRLSSDSEIIAMRASGISLFRITLPVLLFGLIMTGISFFISEVVVTWSEPMAKRIEFAAAYSIPFSPSMDDFAYFERSGGRRIGQGALKRIFHVKRVDPVNNILNKVTILDYSQEDVEQIYYADSGRWNPDKNGWELMNGISYYVSRVDPAAKSHTSRFDRILIPAGKSTEDLIKKLSEIKGQSLFDLWDTIEKHKTINQGEPVNIQSENIHKLLMLFHQKLAYPFSCLAIALAGAPLGILGRRSRTNWGYIQVGVLIFMYYALQSAMNSLGDTGKLDPIIASWLPNIVLATIGSIVLWRRSKFVS
jgi:lipopolysaccharide export system permease protein